MCASTSRSPYPELTPIIRDMQTTARELGIVKDLTAIRQCGCISENCADRLDHALAMLGVTPTPPPLADPREPDPRD